jgi:hypothetical protein
MPALAQPGSRTLFVIIGDVVDPHPHLQAPHQYQRQLADRLPWVLADNRDWLGRRNTEGELQSSSGCQRRSILQQPPASPTQFVAPAHEEIIADGMDVSHIPLRSRSREDLSLQTFASIPHASSKSWGTYLLSLCFLAHSFNGIEFRYSFSDSFNLRTISSNEVGVLGISP